MSRKKWTPKTEVDANLIQFREKRKWQIALRRYVLEKNKSTYYAPFFALAIDKFREWIEVQFDEELSWDNFSKSWQFDHIVPVAYFDFNQEEDMRLCWNFTNIRVEKTTETSSRTNQIDALAAKTYFTALFERTGYPLCQQMIQKISAIEAAQMSSNANLEQFILGNKDYLESLAEFSSYEYEKLNTGTPFETVLFEINFLKKFGT